MTDDELRLNCHRSELASLPVAQCSGCGKDVQARAHLTNTLASAPDPVYTLDWSCPDKMCAGRGVLVD